MPSPRILVQAPECLSKAPNFEAKPQNYGAFFPKFRSKAPASWTTLPAVWSPRRATRSPVFCDQRAKYRFALSGAKTPVTDRAWAIDNLRKFCAPSTKSPQVANLQWSVCLHVAQSGNTFRGSSRSIRECIPSSFLLNLEIHSEVLLSQDSCSIRETEVLLAQFGNTF